MRLINYSKVRRSAATDLKKYERLGVKMFTDALKLQAKPNPSPLPMQEAYVKFYQTVFVDSAKKEFDRIRQDNREKAFVPDDFFLNTWKEWIRDWVLQNLGGLITDVNDNTLKQIQQTLGEGIEQGLNPFQLEKLLFEQIPNINRARAIARTESTRAYNEGKKRSATDWANQTGTKLWKIWIHGGAKEPRFQHIQAQDKPIKSDQPFIFSNNGVQVFMDKPGDINGGAAQTINCSCVVVYVSEAYARRNFPDTFNNNLPPVITPIVPTTTNLNPSIVANTKLKDDLILSTQENQLNKQINDILSKSDGVNDLMNRNGSLLAIRNESQASKLGVYKFSDELGIDTRGNEIGFVRKIGGGLDGAQGNCASNGAFMNILVKENDVVDFKKVSLNLSNSEIEKLLSSGYKKIKLKNGETSIYNAETLESIGSIDKNGDFNFWSVSEAMRLKTGKNNIATTITHESAHMMQAFKDRDLKVWNNIIDSNNLSPQKDSLTEYGRTNFAELYAETFTAFVYDNNGLKTRNPKLYNTFVKYIEQIGVDINTIKLAN